MKLFFFTDARFHQTADGKIYAGEYSYSDILWKRYTAQFSKVYVIARLFQEQSFLKCENQVTGVTILAIEAFESPSKFLFIKKSICNTIDRYFKLYQPDAVILRGAGSIGYLGAKYCIKKRISYGIEVVGDPYDVYAPGVVKHPLRFLLRKLFTYYQKKAVAKAQSVIYVTAATLQQRYPASKTAFSTYASDVVISQRVNKLKNYNQSSRFRIVSIGALEQLYKAPDIVLRSIKKLKDEGMLVDLIWLGKGKFLDEMQFLANELGVAELVSFKGSVSADEVIKYLDNADAFVLVSRTEGLPRAIVEAMARALPCIGSNVGGIPELIHPQLLVEVENSDQLATKIRELMYDANLYKEMSSYSLKIVESFQPAVLEKRRNEFFNELKERND